MKVSKKQLKRIIREERSRLLNEQPDLGPGLPPEEWYEIIADAYMARGGGGALPSEHLPNLITALNMVVEDLQNELDHPEDY